MDDDGPSLAVVSAPAAPELPVTPAVVAPMNAVTVAEPSPVAAVVETPSAAPQREPTLLARIDAEAKVATPAVETVNADKPPVTIDATPAVDANALQPFEYKFTFPETLRADEPRVKAYTDILAEGDAKVPAEKAQKLLDLHAAAMAEFATQYDTQAKQQSEDVWNGLTRDWATRSMADPEFGGSGWNTSKHAIARARDTLISSAKPGSDKYKADHAEFQELDATTRIGSHPAFLRMLHNAVRYIDEPQAHQIPVDIRPTRANGRAPKGSMYTHPSSEKMGQ